MTEVQSRAKDIMFTDKDQSLGRMSRLLTRHINLIETLYDIFKEYNHSKLDKDIIKYVEKEHKILVEKFAIKILQSKELVGKIMTRLYDHKTLTLQPIQLKNLLLKERIRFFTIFK